MTGAQISTAAFRMTAWSISAWLLFLCAKIIANALGSWLVGLCCTGLVGLVGISLCTSVRSSAGRRR